MYSLLWVVHVINHMGNIHVLPKNNCRKDNRVFLLRTIVVIYLLYFVLSKIIPIFVLRYIYNGGAYSSDS